MINRLINQSLAGLHYLLALAVSVIVIIIAIVAFRSLVDEPDAAPVTTTTSVAPPATTIAAAAPAASAIQTIFNCNRGAPNGANGTRVVRLFYACGPVGDPIGATWVYRVIDAEAGTLTATMQQLVAGPEPEERRDGFRSLFSIATAGAVLSITREAGGAIVDLRDLGPLPSLSTGSDGARFLTDLNNTVFQHEDVTAVEYRIEGSCDRFWAYFDRTGCRIVTRAEWAEDPAAAG